MAITWLLKDERITSVLIGASTPDQITENVKGLAKLEFMPAELAAIQKILSK
jgi:L-glyceraldehyde 3-phosphate reductase